MAHRLCGTVSVMRVQVSLAIGMLLCVLAVLVPMLPGTPTGVTPGRNVHTIPYPTETR